LGGGRGWDAKAGTFNKEMMMDRKNKSLSQEVSASHR